MADDLNLSYRFDLDEIAKRFVADEDICIADLIDTLDLDETMRATIVAQASQYAEKTRADFAKQSTVDHLLQEYGLATEEGVELMRLCEALIRTPDFATARLLVRDKFENGDWASHAGGSSRFLVNRATNGLQVAQYWIRQSGGKEGRSLAAKIGDYPLAGAVRKTMRMLGGHFVFEQSIEKALKKARKAKDLYSFDMLGEAAYTQADADRYYESYLSATRAIVDVSDGGASVEENNGISVKLSALHPRYEYAKRKTCVPVLAQRLLNICAHAKQGNIGVTIDAEESERLEISLLVFERLMTSPALENWNGLGIVVQAYQRRAPILVKELLRLSELYQRRICIRLVKGAYWDAEIKRAQELGLESYPVYTRREATDLSYLACAKLLLNAGEWIYPQFASHNAHTLAAIQQLGADSHYEFQRLHGMGDSLHAAVTKASNRQSRVYAPIGNYHDLLPYLVRRLVENGANSSFLNQLMNEETTLAELVQDPITFLQSGKPAQHPKIPDPRDICGGGRLSGRGMDTLQSQVEARLLENCRSARVFEAGSLVGGKVVGRGAERVINPAQLSDCVGAVTSASIADVDEAVSLAKASRWAVDFTPEARAKILRRAADLLEDEMETFLELCVREAGKTFIDAIAEVREAIDFCRYYADQCETDTYRHRIEHGVVACISPWNFPAAIFIGQVVAALSVGNRVVAKPAPQTPVIAFECIRLLHRAGVPVDALHLVHGPAQEIGNHLTGHLDVAGVCFTGSTATAKIIAARLAETGRPETPYIAETGGINAMIVDSTALIEQAVSDVIASSFQSAGQRCSACRLVCVQDDIYEPFKEMLIGAMNALKLGDPALFDTDVGPVIDAAAKERIEKYIETAKSNNQLSHQIATDGLPEDGYFVLPSLIELGAIAELTQEVFGPVLHMVRFQASEFDQVISHVNQLGYGLTLGLHSRLDARAAYLSENAEIGNIYVNRNQIGAVVGIQPFGGEGLSGTGPKAGGPHYLSQFTRSAVHEPLTTRCEVKPSRHVDKNIPKGIVIGIDRIRNAQRDWSRRFGFEERRVLLREAFHACTGLGAEFWQSLNVKTQIELPGPTGESNQLYLHPRGVLLCLGDDAGGVQSLIKQLATGLVSGSGIILTDTAATKAGLEQLVSCLSRNCVPSDLIFQIPHCDAETLASLPIDGVVADGLARQSISTALSYRQGSILPLLSANDMLVRFFCERTVTINTTAAGGNASLLTLD